jgi:hypothetical protein
MTIGTAGTVANNALTALFMPGSFTPPAAAALAIVQTDADMASMQQLMRDDFNLGQPSPPGGPMLGWSRAGQLYIPNRGWLKVFPGDMVAVDATGWPILVANHAAISGQWPHTAT